MTTVAVVSPGFMGAALGAVLQAGGVRVVATLDGRSARTGTLAAGLELLPTLTEVVAAADMVLSVTPPGAALAAARDIAAAARRAENQPIVVDCNAVSPDTMARIAEVLAGLPVVDGSISGPPPSVRPGARLYLSGPAADRVAELPWQGRVEPVVLAGDLGAASALKMCTGSVYKGLVALVTQAMRTAGHFGVLEPVLADLERNGLADTGGVAQSATKAHRYVGEMTEVATTQAAAGLTPDLFRAIAAVYADVATTALAAGDPENVGEHTAAEVVDRLRHG
jgi:3-hydroxyisobutyrate dehydrogenase-like beta-hydroxyacid dehydrogenase